MQFLTVHKMTLDGYDYRQLAVLTFSIGQLQLESADLSYYEIVIATTHFLVPQGSVHSYNHSVISLALGYSKPCTFIRTITHH